MKSDKNILKPVFSLFWCLGAIFRGICSVSSPCTAAVHCACTVRALCVHCQNTHPHTHTRAQLRLETYRTLQKPGMAEEENRWRLRKTHVSVYVYELAVSHRGCEESRKDFYIEISYNKYVGSYIHTNIRTYIRTYSQTCEHAASAQLGQKTRRQDFCRRYPQKVCIYPTSKRFQKGHTYVHTCKHTYTHTYIHTYIQTKYAGHACIQTCKHACMHMRQAECVCFDSARTVHAQCTPQCTPQCTRRKWCK